MGDKLPPEQARLLRQITRRSADYVIDSILAENHLNKEMVERLFKKQGEIRIGFAQVIRKLSSDDPCEEVLHTAHMDSPEIATEKISLSEIQIDPEIIQIVPRHIARRYKVVPVRKARDGALMIALSDPTDIETLDSLQYVLKMNVVGIVATKEDIEKAFEKYYPGKVPVEVV